MKVVFMGTPQAAVPALHRIISDGHKVAAIYTQPDRPSGRGNKIVFSPVKQFALDRSLRVYQPAKIKTPEALAIFRSHQADVAVVVAYGRILPESFLIAYSNGAINVHFSLLPKYRGAAPVNWAIANGETVSGVTTMKMDAGLDTGDILLQRETGIGTEETASELMERLSADGAELLSATLAKLRGITPRKQNELDASVAPILRREDGLIDWNLPANQIVNHIRGFQPFPSSFTLLKSQRVTIWRAKASNCSQNHAAGTVVSTDEGKIAVACGNDSQLIVEELQIEGKRRMSAAEFMNGVRSQVGDKFESR